MTDKDQNRPEKEVKSTFTDDDSEVNTVSESDGNLSNSKYARKIFEAAVGLNAVDRFVSGDPVAAFVLSTVAAVILYYGGKSD